MNRKQFNKIAKFDKNDWVEFDMPVDFNELLDNTGGIESINNMVDEFVDRGHLLMDLSYKPVGIKGDTLIVHVTADASEFLDKEQE